MSIESTQIGEFQGLWYKRAVTQSETPGLVRAIGRWSLVALMVNSIIGSGIFGLPSVIAGLLGPLSPLAVLIAGGMTGVIMACYAEVASQFAEAGGPYLYARVAFGRLLGIEMGWLLWLARLTAPAANANLFVIYLGEFWPAAKEPLPRLLILTALVGALALVNYRGVRAGAQLSNVFTIAKLVPLLGVIGAGGLYLMTHGRASQPLSPTGASTWLKAILLLFFAYGGFESALTPMSEAKDPRRDAAFALFTALGTCIVVYTLVQWVVVSALPDAAHADRPLAEVARLVAGRAGAAFVAVGALVSVYGFLSANMLAVPRITLALAQGRDFPAKFAAIHPEYRTPHFSILVFAGLMWLLALFGSFTWNVTLSAVARLFYYGVGCAALPVLRRKQPEAAGFRLSGGRVWSVAGVIICMVLVTQVDLSGFLILAATVLASFLNWFFVQRATSAVAP